MPTRAAVRPWTNLICVSHNVQVSFDFMRDGLFLTAAFPCYKYVMTIMMMMMMMMTKIMNSVLNPKPHRLLLP